MANYSKSEIECIHIIKQLISSNSEYVFSPYDHWMIVQKTGYIPNKPLAPKQQLKGLEVEIRPEIKGLPTTIFLSEDVMHEFSAFNQPKTNLYKLHNYALPAVSVGFYAEHKYRTYRVDKNYAETIIEKISDADKHDIPVDLFSQDYVFLLSNYLKDYRYYTAFISGHSKSDNKVIRKNSHIAVNKVNIIFLTNELINGTNRHKNRYSNKSADAIIKSANVVADLHTNDLMWLKKEDWLKYSKEDSKE